MADRHRPRSEAGIRSGEGRLVARDGLVFCFAVFFVARVLLSLVAVLAVHTVVAPTTSGAVGKPVAMPGYHNAIDGTQRWDALRFESIARDGYQPDGASAAFFPGYPLAIRAVASLSWSSEPSAALIVSNVAFLAALITLYALTLREFSEDVARRTILLLTFFPTSFFFLAPYSESLFLIASVLTFWFSRGNRPWLAGSFGFLTGAVRSAGVLTGSRTALRCLASTPDKRTGAIFASFLPLLAPVMYCAYWFHRSGDFLEPFHAQASWDRSFVFPLVTLINGLWLGLSGIGDPRGIYWTIDLLVTAAVLIPLAVRVAVIPAPYLCVCGRQPAVIFSYPLPARPSCPTHDSSSCCSRCSGRWSTCGKDVCSRSSFRSPWSAG